MKKTVSIILLIAACVMAYAQDAARADQLFQQGDYTAAYQQYLQLHRHYPGTVLYTYRLGRCEQELGRPEEAVALLLEAGDRYSMRPYWLAVAAYHTYRFSLAKQMFTAYLDANDPSNTYYAAAEEGLLAAEQGERFFHRVENIAFIDSVSFPLDSLASHLPALSSDMGKITYSGQQFSFTNQRGDRRYLSITDSITGRRLIGRQQRLLDSWTPIDTLPAIVNQFHQQDFPILMPDGVTLYFAARSTPEDTVSAHTSKGNSLSPRTPSIPQEGLGNWDIYVTKYNAATNTYLTPELLGMPFNSFAADPLYIFDEMACRGYFLTNRASSPGLYTLYTFLPCTPHFLRDTTADYLRDYVQLRTLPMASQEAPIATSSASPEAAFTSPILQELARTEPEWTLVLNDSTIYTSLDDFDSADALAKMQEYLDILTQIDEESAELQAQRLAYQNAESAAERLSLKPLILSLEKDVRRLKTIAKALRLEVVRLEK